MYLFPFIDKIRDGVVAQYCQACIDADLSGYEVDVEVQESGAKIVRCNIHGTRFISEVSAPLD